MKLYFLVITLFTLSTSFTNQSNHNYYEGTQNLKGEQLKSFLHNIIKDHKVYPYSSKNIDTWDILKISDQDPNNSNNVICVYSGLSVNGNDEYPTWEREHVWSQSHGDFGRERDAGTDLHHLKPVLSITNRTKGKLDKDFDEGGKELFFTNGSSTNCYVTDSTFEPRAEVKGDVARMIFYMATRYETEKNKDGDTYDLELVEYKTQKLPNTKDEYYGKLSTLLKWHKEDPVDAFEIRRNQIIYSYQGNRNPYIDHPEYVNRIWNY